MTITDARQEQAASLRRQVAELERECEILTAQLEGNIPSATFWLQGKVTRQRAALDALNRTVVSQRFVLRTLDELGRSLSADEYRAARGAVKNEQLRDRIEDPDAK
jgi:hypothetical protein